MRILNGGFSSWKAAGGKVKQEARQYGASKYECHLRPQMFSSKEDVLAAIKDEDVITVNTLNPESYAQAHITGSSLLPCTDLMLEWDSFVPDDALASRLKAESQHERIITYCGGGIAATVNAMAHLMAGNQKVSVYDGSMDEWVGEGLLITKG